jgi:hypothetical protein
MRYRWTPVYVLATLFVLQAAVSAEEPKIGSAKATKNQVEGVINGQNKPLSTGSEVFTNETVRTGNTGVADLVFIDNTNLSVGPTSEIKLDKFVYDPTGSNGAVVIQATKGAFRFVTGSQDHRVYQINTPFGTLGVRGTIVEMVLKPCLPGVPRTQCGVSIKVVEGSATFNGAALQANGQVYSVDGNGIATQSSQSGSILNFASASTQGATGSLGGGGGGGGTTGSLGQNGGNNNSTPTPGENHVASTGPGPLTTGGVSGSSSGGSPF